MKALLCFILGVIVGAYGLRVYERRQGLAPASSLGETTRESTAGIEGTVSDKLTEWHLTPDDIRSDLARTGQVVRDRTQGVRAQIGDARIVTVIKAKYVLDSNLSARDISVHSEDGRVRLEGTVASPELVGAAVALALDTDGVRSVTSRIQVARP
ncbi:MAG TPA: BON domain-containing protein [Opitutaceae bacterium]|nr:BON domain-containing protein [Opitutaceae bacterium]